MTRKDYRQLAEELRISYGRLTSEEARRAFRSAVNCIADALKRENPRFDYDKFSDAVYWSLAK